MTKELKNRILENKVLTHDERMEIIKALEQSSEDCVSRADLLKLYEDRFIELQKAHHTDKQLGVNWCINTLKEMPPVKPTLPKGVTNEGLCNSCINIGCEFQSGIVRTECAFYMPPNIEPDNCGNYVVMQQPSDDCVSRKAMLNAITEIDNNVNMDIYTNEVREIVKELPPVTPKLPTSDDCVSRQMVKEGMIKYGFRAPDMTVTEFIEDELPPVIPTRKVGKWEYKQLGFRKYGLVCTSCGYAIHLGYEFTSMEEFKDMVERKLQNPHITMDMFCRKCGAEMRGNEND